MFTIVKAEQADLEKILNLQYLAYQSEADLFGSRDIPPLKQTLDEVTDEYNNGIILKSLDDSNNITGSVRAVEKNGTVFIGKLMVHPIHRGKGLGSALLNEIEHYYPDKRYELFTSTRSMDNIRMYQNHGYVVYDSKPYNDEIEFVYMEKKSASMDFEYYNPSDESRSCVVRTMTKLTGKDYATVKAELTDLASKNGCESYNDEAVFSRYMAEHGIHKMQEYGNTTVGELKLDDGIYCVFATNRNGFYHLMPVVDNVIYDRRDDCRSLYVIAVYKKENV